MLRSVVMWKVVLVAVVLILGVGLLAMAQPAGKADEPAMRAQVLKASEFRVVGPDGQVRARLGLAGDGQPSLAFYNEKMQGCLVMGLTKGNLPLMVLYDAQNHIRLGVEVRPEGDVRLAFYDTAEQERMVLAVTKSGTTALRLTDPSAPKRSAVVALSAAGVPFIGLSDANGMPLFYAPRAEARSGEPPVAP